MAESSNCDETRLLVIVEVAKEDRVLCQAEECKHPIYKRIHVVREGGALKVIGSECFKRIYAGILPDAQIPQYGSLDRSRVLSAAERQALLENTERLLAELETEYAEKERRELARLETKRLQDQERDTRLQRLAEEAKNKTVKIPALPGRSQRRAASLTILAPHIQHPSALTNSDMAEFQREARASVARSHPGIDLDSPGFIGLIKLEVMRLRRARKG